METITCSSFINCTLEELCDFHLDTNNITLITPKNTKVELIDYENETYEGKIVKLKTTRAFIPVYWEVKIEKYQYPNIMIDKAIKSPFEFWEHQHIFTQRGSVCELKDIIRFKPPFGFLGRLIAPLLKKDIQSMFEYRHKQTKLLLEKKKES